MEMNYVFMTDSDSDLPYHLKAEYDIPVVYMPYALNGESGIRHPCRLYALCPERKGIF